MKKLLANVLLYASIYYIGIGIIEELIHGWG